MKFLIDAQLPPRLAGDLIRLGHQAEHVVQMGLGWASDGEIWDLAVTSGTVVVTKDGDFAGRRQAATTGPAILWLRFGNTTADAVFERLAPVLDEILRALEGGETLVEVR